MHVASFDDALLPVAITIVESVVGWGFGRYWREIDLNGKNIEGGLE